VTINKAFAIQSNYLSHTTIFASKFETSSDYQMTMQQSALRNNSTPGRPALAGGHSLKTFESDDSSFSIRVKKAGHEIHSKHLWAIFCVICLALVTVNSLGFIILEYWIVDDNTADTNRSSIPNSCEIYGLSKNVPMCSWNDRDFISYVTIVIWLTMVLTGLGTEVLSGSCSSREVGTRIERTNGSWLNSSSHC